MAPKTPFDPALSQRRIEEGKLPSSAAQRLQELRDAATVFTSTLTPAEQGLARQEGYDPIAQVMGSCFYHVGISWQTGWSAGELDAATHALEEVRRRALNRLREEAKILGAHLVVGVKILSAARGESVLEFSANGTAVRIRGAAPAIEPALSLLDADELLKAHRAGFWPVGIAIGNSVVYDPHCDCQADSSWQNTELLGHTQLARMAEKYALERFQADATAQGADGVIGVTVHRGSHSHTHENHTTFQAEMLLIGTAVRRVAPKTDGKRAVVIFDLSRDAFRPKGPPTPTGHGGH